MRGKRNRRDFIKHTAFSGLGVAASSCAVGLILPKSASASAEDSDYDWTKHRWIYLIDTRTCIGCGSCVRTCRKENNVPEGRFRTWIERYAIPLVGETHIDSPRGGEFGFDPDPSHQHVKKSFFVPKLCNHCANTPCTQVCPVGASFSTVDGVVLVDSEQCIGCGYCVQACPYGSRYFNPETHTAEKCTLCYHRITKGMSTACVETCPVEARMLGDRLNPDDPVVEILETERVQILQPHLLTQPQCFYLGLDKEVR
jgi:Fe-S-cluster-containing dehydrogenase component